MSSSNFTPIPAKPTFGSKQPIMFASDYINNKKIKTQFCNSSSCLKNNSLLSQGNLINYNKFYYYQNSLYKRYNTANLNINLITHLDLKNVNVLQNNNPVTTPTTINSSENFNNTYTIDETGVLFGNTNCGINNYVNFQVLNQ